jgi:hypothetical protein
MPQGFKEQLRSLGIGTVVVDKRNGKGGNVDPRLISAAYRMLLIEKRAPSMLVLVSGDKDYEPILWIIGSKVVTWSFASINRWVQAHPWTYYAFVERNSSKSQTQEAQDLARKYVEAGVVVETFYSDALHLAIASTHDMDYLIGWNFRHIVNVRTRALVTTVNVNNGLRQLDIVAPPEMR